MSFIAILLSLIIDRFVESAEDLRRFDWFYRFSDWVFAKLQEPKYFDGPLGVILVMGPVMLIVWLGVYILGGITVMFELLLSIGILFYCLGPKDMEREIQQYLDATDAESGDDASSRAADFLGYQTTLPPMELAQAMKEAIFVKINDRILGVFLWFILLGPMGAALFRLSCIEKQRVVEQDSDYANAARRLYQILMWPSARLCVLAYPIVGSFVGTMSRWNSFTDLWQRDSEDLLVASGLGALHERPPSDHLDDEPDLYGVREAMALVKRVVIVCITVLAIFTIIGWLA